MTLSAFREGSAAPARAPLAWLTLVLAWLALCLPVHAQSGPTFPQLTGRVVDQAQLLSPQTEAALTEKLAALERDTSDQLVVVTVDSLQDYEIEDYGYRLGRAWSLGQKDKDNGALLIIAPNERKIRIEVGYGLEPILTDALSSQIIQSRILPAFREGDFERGVVDGVGAVDEQLRLDPAEAQARAAAAAEAKPEAPVGAILIVGVIFLFLFLGLVGGAARRGRRAGGMGEVLLWIAAEALKEGARGGGGGRGGWGGGGGGFGGGGGSFGGGGASGGW